MVEVMDNIDESSRTLANNHGRRSGRQDPVRTERDPHQLGTRLKNPSNSGRRPRRYDTSRHDQLVSGLVAAGMSRTGFRPALLAATGINVPALYPDAFRIDADELEVRVFEVVVTHGLTPDKVRRYQNLAWILDALEWDLTVVIVNRYGHFSELGLVALTAEYMGLHPATPTWAWLVAAAATGQDDDGCA